MNWALPLPGDGPSGLFQVINQRYLKSSTILTTPVSLADWAGAFGDATFAAAMLDRLLHRAAVVGIDGPSYRLGSHQSHAYNPHKGSHRHPQPLTPTAIRNCRTATNRHYRGASRRPRGRAAHHPRSKSRRHPDASQLRDRTSLVLSAAGGDWVSLRSRKRHRCCST
ncbi:ATP-binding protein [Streptomyces sp. NPDC046182]|uniref:ATP-binding protein n=1 Tax=Streptomyces sp. NPDC046182 TaxID=3154601 RepID=UPI0033D6588A